MVVRELEGVLDALNCDKFFNWNNCSRSDDGKKDKMIVKTLPCNLSFKSFPFVSIKFWDFPIFYQFFLSPQL